MAANASQTITNAKNSTTNAASNAKSSIVTHTNDFIEKAQSACSDAATTAATKAAQAKEITTNAASSAMSASTRRIQSIASQIDNTVIMPIRNNYELLQRARDMVDLETHMEDRINKLENDTENPTEELLLDAARAALLNKSTEHYESGNEYYTHHQSIVRTNIILTALKANKAERNALGAL